MMKKTDTLPVALLCLAIMTSFLSGCITTYRHMDPTAHLTRHCDTIENSDLRITWSANVLYGARTKLYRKMANRNGVRLLALEIENSASEKFILNNDVTFLTMTGDTIYPLLLEEAIEALIDPVEDEEAMIEIEDGYCTFRPMINDIKKAISHVRFAQDMWNNYLFGTTLETNEIIAGWLVIPLRMENDFLIHINPEPENEASGGINFH